MKSQPQKRKAGGKPFQSKLEPYFDEIRAARLARKTWAQIAEQITKNHHVDCTPPGVFAFFKSKRKRRYALGMDPNDPPVLRTTTLPEPDGPGPVAPAPAFKDKLLAKKPLPKPDVFGPKP